MSPQGPVMSCKRITCFLSRLVDTLNAEEIVLFQQRTEFEERALLLNAERHSV